MSLLSSSTSTTILSPALPVRNSVFQRIRLFLREGQFTLLGAAPSVGKSVFARNLVVKTPVPSLFFSADSDEYTVRIGIAACLTQEELVKVEDQLKDEAWDDYYTSIFKQADHVEWSFASDIGLDFIVDRTEAYAEMYGDYPKLMVIDNLGDMLTEDGGDIYIELRRICRELRAIARKTHCHIFALTHLTGEYEDGYKEVTLKAFEGKVGKVPENVLGLNWDKFKPGQVYMTVPKARLTKRGMTVPIQMDYTRGLVRDFQ